jgi:hypothetical protein
MVAVAVGAPEVTLADLTISRVGFHGIQIRGEAGAHKVAIHNVRILDTGQQLIKGSTVPGSAPCRDGLVACSTLAYTDSAPSDYTNGIDVLNGENWVVRDNILRRIRGPRSQGYRSGPAILFWGGSSGTIVERNLVLDCYRGIALGLSPGQSGVPDHRGGVVRRNAICNLDGRSDEPMEINGSAETLVEHNTVMVEGKVPWSISIRFAALGVRVYNNLTSRQIARRDGGQADLKGNVTNARRDWFVGADRGDLRLGPRGRAGLASSRATRAGDQASAPAKLPDVGAYPPDDADSTPDDGGAATRRDP